MSIKTYITMSNQLIEAFQKTSYYQSFEKACEIWNEMDDKERETRENRMEYLYNCNTKSISPSVCSEHIAKMYCAHWCLRSKDDNCWDYIPDDNKRLCEIRECGWLYLEMPNNMDDIKYLESCGLVYLLEEKNTKYNTYKAMIGPDITIKYKNRNKFGNWNNWYWYYYDMYEIKYKGRNIMDVVTSCSSMRNKDNDYYVVVYPSDTKIQNECICEYQAIEFMKKKQCIN